MSTASDKLREMVDGAEEQIEAIQSSIDQVQEQIDELQEQDDAIVDGVLDPVAIDLSSYLVVEVLPNFSEAEVYIGPSYNVITYGNELTDWAIIDSTTSAVLYEYEGTGWDDSTAIINLVEEWNFGNDYLTRPLTTGATYGIRPFKSALEDAKTILINNRDKISDSETVFERFAT